MKFFENISLVFRYVSRLFRLDPGYFMLSVFSQICNAAAAVLMLWLPKIILDEFVGDRNITKIIIMRRRYGNIGDIYLYRREDNRNARLPSVTPPEPRAD